MDDPRISAFYSEFESLGLSKVRIALSTGEFKLTPLKEPAAKEWVHLKEIQEQKPNHLPAHYWYQKPIGLIGISLASGILLLFTTYLVSKYFNIRL